MSSDMSKEDWMAYQKASAAALGFEHPERTREEDKPVLRELLGDEMFDQLMADEALASRDPGQVRT